MTSLRVCEVGWQHEATWGHLSEHVMSVKDTGTGLGTGRAEPLLPAVQAIAENPFLVDP